MAAETLVAFDDCDQDHKDAFVAYREAEFAFPFDEALARARHTAAWSSADACEANHSGRHPHDRQDEPIASITSTIPPDRAY